MTITDSDIQTTRAMLETALAFHGEVDRLLTEGQIEKLRSLATDPLRQQMLLCAPAFDNGTLKRDIPALLARPDILRRITLYRMKGVLDPFLAKSVETALEELHKDLSCRGNIEFEPRSPGVDAAYKQIFAGHGGTIPAQPVLPASIFLALFAPPLPVQETIETFTTLMPQINTRDPVQTMDDGSLRANTTQVRQSCGILIEEDGAGFIVHLYYTPREDNTFLSVMNRTESIAGAVLDTQLPTSDIEDCRWFLHMGKGNVTEAIIANADGVFKVSGFRDIEDQETECRMSSIETWNILKAHQRALLRHNELIGNTVSAARAAQRQA